MVRCRRSSLVLLLIAGLVAFGPAASVLAQDATPTAATATGTGDRTDLRYVVPFTPDGLNPGLTASRTERGRLWLSLLGGPRSPGRLGLPGAEGQIYDPCFENPFLTPDEPALVACFDSPFSTEVVVLR